MGAAVDVDDQAGRVTAAMNHDELVLLAELSSVNQDMARYIGRVLDVDRGLTEFTTPLSEVERELGARLVAVGQALDAQARSRLIGAGVSGLTIAGDVAEGPSDEPG
ncbi:MAG: hypothetical protein ACRDSK_06485 [Actinophytocola sp.]|uniref:hypothetical protein n=1 Tax=Actinophytocola sp. TaxID=1872138 RepID=UPI003D6C5D74